MRLVVAWTLLIFPIVSLQAQQLPTMTLACNGTSKLMVVSDEKPEPITNVGIIVNFADRSVTFNSYRIPIERADSTMVLFHGQQAMSYAGTNLKPVMVDGSIDRVTGAASVSFMHERVGNNSTWDLMCRPAARLS
jgi:hypothetical protein